MEDVDVERARERLVDVARTLARKNRAWLETAKTNALLALESLETYCPACHQRMKSNHA